MTPSASPATTAPKGRTANGTAPTEKRNPDAYYSTKLHWLHPATPRSDS